MYVLEFICRNIKIFLFFFCEFPYESKSFYGLAIITEIGGSNDVFYETS